MKIKDKELKAALELYMEREEEKVRKEMENVEEHIFSDEFNRKMDKLFADIDQSIECANKRKKRMSMLYKAAPVALVLVLVIGGLMKDKISTVLNASNPSINISEWHTEFFKFKGAYESTTETVWFDESQIGYVPKGFEKTEEDISASMGLIKYENELGNYIYVVSCDTNTVTRMNSENIIQDVRVKEDGIEYLYIENTKTKELIIIFQGNDKCYYTITGIVSEEEIIKVMDGIKH